MQMETQTEGSKLNDLAFESEVERLTEEPSLNDITPIGDWLPDYVHKMEIKARVLDQLLGSKDWQEHPVLSELLSVGDIAKIEEVLATRINGEEKDSGASGAVRRLSQLIVVQDLADQFRDAIETKVEEMTEAIKRSRMLTDSAVKVEVNTQKN